MDKFLYEEIKQNVPSIQYSRSFVSNFNENNQDDLLSDDDDYDDESSILLNSQKFDSQSEDESKERPRKESKLSHLLQSDVDNQAYSMNSFVSGSTDTGSSVQPRTHKQLLLAQKLRKQQRKLRKNKLFKSQENISHNRPNNSDDIHSQFRGLQLQINKNEPQVHIDENKKLINTNSNPTNLNDNSEFLNTLDRSKLFMIYTAVLLLVLVITGGIFMVMHRNDSNISRELQFALFGPQKAPNSNGTSIQNGFLDTQSQNLASEQSVQSQSQSLSNKLENKQKSKINTRKALKEQAQAQNFNNVKENQKSVSTSH
ncbi:UNKNOWN [Stylonychia lemnae]|uniref:Transmembrane protein n=1 Tax=Stylonychia lemnae TaxID=5949 RepID=A0A077ZTP1_STYLE|nr:UNKNOWN [Stylonychia lemnae]|eukprot:CDW73267.1 UNKNOWN [Stylonychia lemnae]